MNPIEEMQRLMRGGGPEESHHNPATANPTAYGVTLRWLLKDKHCSVEIELQAHTPINAVEKALFLSPAKGKLVYTDKDGMRWTLDGFEVKGINSLVAGLCYEVPDPPTANDTAKQETAGARDARVKVPAKSGVILGEKEA